MPELYLKTIDSVSIFADWSPAAGDTAKTALLLHQRGKDHTMWDGLRKTLQEKNWNTLAIDLRGHGKSEGLGKNHDLKFDQADDYHSMMFDISAATDFIRDECHMLSAQQNSRRATKSYTLAVVGSSIGANLALAYAADLFEVKAAILLSPGLNYYGLRTDDVMIQYHRPLALITAKDDPSYTDVQKLIKLPGVQRPNLWYREFDSGGHGIKLLEAQPELMEKIVEWTDKQIN